MTPYLYFYMLNLNKLLPDLTSAGSATLNMKTGTFSKAKILKPNIGIAREFHDRTECFMSKLEKNLSAIEPLSALRGTLLPKPVSGQLRVPEAEQQIAEVT